MPRCTASDFEFGPLLTFDMLGIALVAAAVRFERDELCRGECRDPRVRLLVPSGWAGRRRGVGGDCGAGARAMAKRARARRLARLVRAERGGELREHTRARGGGQFCLDQPLQSEFPLLTFLTLQPVVPFWLLLPMPFGVARLVRNDPRRLLVIAVGIAGRTVAALRHRPLPR